MRPAFFQAIRFPRGHIFTGKLNGQRQMIVTENLGAKDERGALHPWDGSGGFVADPTPAMLRDFLACIRERRRSAVFPAESARQTLAMVPACLESSRTEEKILIRGNDAVPVPTMRRQTHRRSLEDPLPRRAAGRLGRLDRGRSAWPSSVCVRVAATAVIVGLGAGCISEQAANPAKNESFTPFLCRDGVVRESAERMTLGTLVVVGKDAPGVGQAFGNTEIGHAASVFTNYVHKITGRTCRVLPTGSAAGAARGRVLIGADGNPLETFPELKRADDHGFVIATRGGDLHIVGRTGTATKFAVWFFLMNYAGLRLVLPGEMGEVYAKRDRLDVPRDLYVFNPSPDYRMRVSSGVYGMHPEAWLADTAATARFEYHHNMGEIYPPETFGRSHPEFYPVQEGKPRIPASKNEGAWQPTFSEPAIVRRAIEYADELFRARPHVQSVSLSVNDGLGYSETDLRRGRLLPDGSVTISDIYYKYVNAVARGIRDKWPDRYVAFFPYNLVKTPPSFALEDNVMIFLLNEPKTTCAEWRGKVKHIGIYQWLYGLWYVVPNHWPHALQDCLRWVRARGGRAFKGEAYPAWAQDAPKLWVLANLLWNADADVDALLRDYYEHAYGKEAAPAMSRYFAQWEKVYERRRSRQEYRFATVRPGERQFKHVTAKDMDILSATLAEAERLVQGDGNRKRLDMVARCFRWAQLYWQQHAALEELRTGKVASESDVTRLIESARTFYDLAPVREQFYKNQIEPLAQYCIYSQDPQKVDWQEADPGFDWRELDAAMDRGLGAITSFQRKTRSADQVGAFWSAVGAEHPKLKPFAETQRLLTLHPNAPLKNLLTNSGFEEPPANDQQVARDWHPYHNRMVHATVALDTNVFRTGRASVTARGLTDLSGVLRSVTVKNRARYRLSFWYRNTPETRHGHLTLMRPPPIREHLPPSPSWRRYEKMFTVDTDDGDTATFYMILTLRHGGSEKSQMWFDDVRLELLSPEGIEAR